MEATLDQRLAGFGLHRQPANGRENEAIQVNRECLNPACVGKVAPYCLVPICVGAIIVNIVAAIYWPDRQVVVAALSGVVVVICFIVFLILCEYARWRLIAESAGSVPPLSYEDGSQTNYHSLSPRLLPVAEAKIVD